jgi:hypothetical protein
MNAKFLAIAGSIFVFAAASGPAQSAEPNEIFAAATVLSASTRIVSDSLTPGHVTFPDTLLGIQNASHQITQIDDNGSLIGDGKASGLLGVPTNQQSISFTVTGVGDNGFVGAHGQTGQYEVFIDVFAADGGPLTSLSEVRTLQPGAINSFAFAGNNDWIGGSYDVNIDNLLGEPSGGDVDFFTFTGFAPGAKFRAETIGPASGINTFLYWYNTGGAVIGIDDNSGEGVYSRIDGVAPADGKLTFAVTGFGDIVNGMPAGEHVENGAYQLRISLFGADFDKNGSVNGSDLNVWKSNYGPTGTADADLDGDSDGTDFLIWQRQVGVGATLAAASRVPEPSGWSLALVLSCCGRYVWPRRRQRRSLLQ